MCWDASREAQIHLTSAGRVEPPRALHRSRAEGGHRKTSASYGNNGWGTEKNCRGGEIPFNLRPASLINVGKKILLRASGSFSPIPAG